MRVSDKWKILQVLLLYSSYTVFEFIADQLLKNDALFVWQDILHTITMTITIIYVISLYRVKYTTTGLSRLKSDARKFEPFIGNRVSEISAFCYLNILLCCFRVIQEYGTLIIAYRSFWRLCLMFCCRFLSFYMWVF